MNVYLRYCFVFLLILTGVRGTCQIIVTDDEKVLNFSRESMLIVAAENGDLAKVDELILEGVDINGTTPEGVTALMYAAQNGHLAVVNKLLEHGADVNVVPENRIGALLAAVLAGHIYIVDTLISRGADINVRDLNNTTPLMHACTLSDTVLSDMLVFYGADLTLRDYLGIDALQYAVAYGNIGHVRLLIRAGSSLQTQDNDGFTPLMVAVQKGYKDIVTELINSGSSINTVNKDGYTALDLAIINNHEEIVDLLLDRGSKTVTADRISPVDLAYVFGGTDTRKSLFEHGARPRYSPFFSSLDAGFSSLFNKKDFIPGIMLALNDSRYKFSITAGYGTRPFARSVRVPRSENFYFQLWEYRSFLELGLTKKILISAPNYRFRWGVQLGVKGLYSYGTYRGMQSKPEKMTLLAPNAGFFYLLRPLMIQVGYEYRDLGYDKIPPHFVFCNLLFRINLLKSKVAMKNVSYL